MKTQQITKVYENWQQFNDEAAKEVKRLKTERQAQTAQQKTRHTMRAIDTYTPEQIDTLKLKGMLSDGKAQRDQPPQPQHSPLRWYQQIVALVMREIEERGYDLSDLGGKTCDEIAAEALKRYPHAEALAEALHGLEAELQMAFDDVPAGVDAWMSLARKALADWKKAQL